MLPTQPLIAVDVVIVSFSHVSGLRVLLPPRATDPFVGTPALPGILLGVGERLEEAAYRAIRDRGGVEAAAVRSLTQISAFDSPGRDPRDHSISIAFVAVVAVDAAPDELWAPIHRDSPAPFAHDEIIEAGIERLNQLLWKDLDVTMALLGRRFGTNTAAALAESVTGIRPRLSTVNRDLGSCQRVKRDGSDWETGRGRPATAWVWA